MIHNMAIVEYLNENMKEWFTVYIEIRTKHLKSMP